MKAICKTKPAPGAEIVELVRPSIRPDELLLKVHRASICGSDLPIYQWTSWARERFKLPRVFGHEFCGTVAEAGASTRDFSPGDFVSVESHVYCGLCFQCQNGQRHVCRNLKIIGVDMEGGFAEYARVPARCAWKHADGALKDVGSLLEPLGNAIHAALVEELVGRSVLVLGCGPQGLFSIQVAKVSGARPILAVEGSPFRQELAKKVGADVVLDPADPNLLQKIRVAVGEVDGVDVVLEMSGAPAAISLALKAVRSGGRISAFGIPPGPVAVDWADELVFRGVRVYGVVGREIFQTWHRMTSLLRSGMLDIRPVVTHVFPFEEFPRAFAAMTSKDRSCGKVILTFE